MDLWNSGDRGVFMSPLLATKDGNVGVGQIANLPYIIFYGSCLYRR